MQTYNNIAGFNDMHHFRCSVKEAHHTFIAQKLWGFWESSQNRFYLQKYDRQITLVLVSGRDIPVSLSFNITKNKKNRWSYITFTKWFFSRTPHIETGHKPTTHTSKDSWLTEPKILLLNYIIIIIMVLFYLFSRYYAVSKEISIRWVEVLDILARCYHYFS